MRGEQVDDRGVVAPGGHVQRGGALVIRPVDVGAVLDGRPGRVVRRAFLAVGVPQRAVERPPPRVHAADRGQQRRLEAARGVRRSDAPGPLEDVRPTFQRGPARVAAPGGQHPHELRFLVVGGEPVRGGADELRRDGPVLARAAQRRPALEARVGIRAAGQQGRRHVPVSPQDRGVQRRIAGPGVVGVGARGQREPREVRVAAVRRHHQRARAGGRRVVDVRAGADEAPARLHVPEPRREQQRRVAAPVPHDALVVLRGVGGGGVHHAGPDPGAGVHVGPVREQHVDDLVVSLGHRPHQRGLPARAFPRVDAGPVRQQLPDGVRAAGARSRHDGRLAVAQRRVGVGARVEQARHHAGAAVVGGEPQRRRAQLVGGVGVGAGVDQERGGLVVVPIGRPVQGGGAVGLRGVDVGSARDERPDRGRVLGPRRLDDGRRVDAAGRRREARRRQGQRPRRRQSADGNPIRCHHRAASLTGRPAPTRGPRAVRRPPAVDHRTAAGRRLTTRVRCGQTTASGCPCTAFPKGAVGA